MNWNSNEPLRRLLACLLVWAVVLTVFVSVIDKPTFRVLFGESGPLEILSTPLWVMLAALCWDPNRPRINGVWACGGVALLAAMREDDWQHDALTNMSRLKIKWYLQPEVPAQDMVVAGAITLVALAVLIYAITLGVRYLLRERLGALRPLWSRVMLIGVVTMVSTKMLDRLINGIFEMSSYRIGGVAGRLVGGFEEGFEMVLPLIFGFALYCYRRQTSPA